MKKLGLVVAVTLGMASAAVHAEDMYRGAWYAVPGVSYMSTDKDFDADDGAGAFISIGKEISQHWDLQGRLGYTKVDEDRKSVQSGDYKSTTLGLDALYMFSRDKFRPFLLGGFGWARNDMDYKLSSGANFDGKKSSWMVNLGLGAQYLFSDRFGLQADLRHQWSRAKEKSVAENINESGSVGNTLLNLGGIFRFGAPVSSAALAPTPVAAAPTPVAAAPAPVAAAPTPTLPKCETETETLTIGAEKLFGFNKDSLESAGKAALDDAAAKINSNSNITLVGVTGHTDRLGSFSYNQALSERRANKVAQHLIAQGVNSDLIVVTGRGESAPIVECKGDKRTKALIQCLQPNRRVQIVVEATKQASCY